MKIVVSLLNIHLDLAKVYKSYLNKRVLYMLRIDMEKNINNRRY